MFFQCLATKRSQIKKMVDFMPNKNDKCFNVLVASLRPRYRWLSLRLERGMEEEKSRLAKVKKGTMVKVTTFLGQQLGCYNTIMMSKIATISSQ